MQADGGAFTHCKQAFNTGFTLLIGFNPTHGVVRGWAHRDRLFYRIHADIGFGQLADKRQAFQQFLLTQMTQVEIDHIAAWGRDSVTFAPLMPEGLRHFVARAKFHVFVLRLAQRSFRAHAVILQIAIAIFIDQNPAFAAAALGHQDAGTRQTGWVILNELHIAQWDPVLQRHAHPVAGDNPAVGVIAVNASGTAGGHYHRVSADLNQRAFHHVHRHQTARLAVIHQDIQHEVLVKALDLRELQRGLEQGMKHVEAGFIGSKPGALNFHAAETTHVHAAVFTAAPRATPLLQLGHFRRAMMDEIIDDILFA
ncbi:hypothetical protein D3C75_354510 [compost metagenome]